MRFSSPSYLSGDLGIWSVLGLTNRDSEEWARLRGMQYAQLALVSRARLLAQAVAALVVVLLFAPVVPHGLILGWLGALCGSLTYCARGLRPSSAADHRLTREEFLRQVLGTTINAMVWAFPIFLFTPQAAVHLRIELWTVLAMLMTVSAVIVPTVPVATLLFSSIVGGTAVAGFLLMGQGSMAAVAALFVICVAAGTIEASRHFLASRLAAASVAENNEVVSLLLREFDEEDANWLWQTDAQRRVRSVSPRFAEALGQGAEEIEGGNFLELLAGPGYDRLPADAGLQALALHLRQRESFSNLLLRVCVRGQRRFWSLSGAPRFDGTGGFLGFRGVASDVTEQQESTEKIAYLARYDTLTGLPNRMMVIDTLSAALASARSGGEECAFLMIDLDRFKAVNDTLGHPVGDQLLAQVAARLQVLMGPGMLCGRLGGDEFCVVMQDARDREKVAGLAQAIIGCLSEPYYVDGHELSIGASVGSACGPEDADSVQGLMRDADFALYRAKRSGRGRHSPYDEALQAEAAARTAMEMALRHAIEREEFELYFQPVVDARSEKLVCFEALLRWNHPEHGQIPPNRFLALAEETRLSLPIGAWVLRQACHEAARWPGKVRVSVNVSDRQALDPAFIDHVVTALASSHLPPQQLCIEVTEGLFQREPSLARATLERLLALGCAVTLDDFGAGHASISFLCELNFSAIKLERALVKGAARGNAESVAMIRAVVALAESLEMVTIAKGVETEQEIEAACLLGCRHLQGIAYGGPMASSAVDGLFAGPLVLSEA